MRARSQLDFVGIMIQEEKVDVLRIVIKEKKVRDSR